MRKVLAAIALVAVLVGLNGGAHACTCAPERHLLERIERVGFPTQVAAVFHGRVVATGRDTEATVEVLESFRESPSVAKRLSSSGNGGDCGVIFTVGEEWIFMPSKDGYVMMCWRLTASPENLLRVRAIARSKR